MASFEAARNVEDVLDQRQNDQLEHELLHPIESVIDLARDDGDETELVLETTAGPLAYLTMGCDPEQTIRVTPQQAREIARKLVAWADSADPIGDHPAVRNFCEQLLSKQSIEALAEGVYEDPLCADLGMLHDGVRTWLVDCHGAELRGDDATADTEPPQPQIVDLGAALMRSVKDGAR
jgi:hypothetical protein